MISNTNILQKVSYFLCPFLLIYTKCSVKRSLVITKLRGANDRQWRHSVKVGERSRFLRHGSRPLLLQYGSNYNSLTKSIRSTGLSQTEVKHIHNLM